MQPYRRMCSSPECCRVRSVIQSLPPSSRSTLVREISQASLSRQQRSHSCLSPFGQLHLGIGLDLAKSVPQLHQRGPLEAVI
jgi:hypothetical protein